MLGFTLGFHKLENMVDTKNIFTDREAGFSKINKAQNQ
jgi:hypothetical protein